MTANDTSTDWIDLEIEQAMHAPPWCPQCGCHHDEEITPGRSDSCYREQAPLWAAGQAWEIGSRNIALIIERLLQRCRPANVG